MSGLLGGIGGQAVGLGGVGGLGLLLFEAGNLFLGLLDVLDRY